MGSVNPTLLKWSIVCMFQSWVVGLNGSCVTSVRFQPPSQKCISWPAAPVPEVLSHPIKTWKVRGVLHAHTPAHAFARIHPHRNNPHHIPHPPPPPGRHSLSCSPERLLEDGLQVGHESQVLGAGQTSVWAHRRHLLPQPLLHLGVSRQVVECPGQGVGGLHRPHLTCLLHMTDNLIYSLSQENIYRILQSKTMLECSISFPNHSAMLNETLKQRP